MGPKKGNSVLTSLETVHHSNLMHLSHQKFEYPMPLLGFNFLNSEGAKAPVPIFQSEWFRSTSTPTDSATRWQFHVFVEKKYHPKKGKHFKNSKKKSDSSAKILIIKLMMKRITKETTPTTTCKGQLKLKRSKTIDVVSTSFSGTFKNESVVCTLELKESCFLLPSEIEKSQLEEAVFMLSCDVHVLEETIEISREENSLNEDFQELWASITYNEVFHFKFNSGNSVKAHKSFLAARTQFFSIEYFQGGEAERSHDKLERNDGKTERNEIYLEAKYEGIMDLILQFIYTDQVSKETWTDQTAWDLVDAAKKFGIPKLLKYAEEFLLKSLTVENSKKFYYLALQHSSSCLKEEAYRLLCRFYSDFSSSPNIWNLVSGLDTGAAFFDLMIETCTLLTATTNVEEKSKEKMQKVGESSVAENIEQHELIKVD